MLWTVGIEACCDMDPLVLRSRSARAISAASCAATSLRTASFRRSACLRRYSTWSVAICLRSSFLWRSSIESSSRRGGYAAGDLAIGTSLAAVLS